MIYLTQIIFIKEGKEEVFHQFENMAIPIMEEYHGKLIYRIRPNAGSFISSDGDRPYEIHFITFRSEQDFLNFSKDKRRRDFLHLKENSIKSSLLVKGEKL